MTAAYIKACAGALRIGITRKIEGDDRALMRLDEGGKKGAERGALVGGRVTKQMSVLALSAGLL